MGIKFDDSSPDVVFSKLKIIKENKAPVFCVRYSPDNDSILIGCGDGHLRVFDTTGRHMYTWNTAGKRTIKLPVTAMRFRPFKQNRKNIVLVAGSGGVVQHWHITSGRCLHTVQEKENQVYAVDYRNDGKIFATSGKDRCVRVYDEATKSLINKMSGGTGSKTAGHSNRVFTLKFLPHDQNMIISGGYDNTLQIWDIRKESAVRRIFGPHICGDALDVTAKGNGVILTGSWRTDHQLQTWDFGTGKLLEDIKIPPDAQTKQKCNIYTACFSYGDAKYIAYGGSGSNEARVIDRITGKIVGSLSGLDKAVYSVAFSPNNNTLAVGGGDGSVYLMNSGK